MIQTARQRLTFTFLLFCLLAFLPGLSDRSATAGEVHFRTQMIDLGGEPIEVEIAETEIQRRKGLMHRTSLAEDSGMLFIYPEPSPICMWMKNTFIALDVAFFDEAGKLLNVASMTPQTLTPHCSQGQAVYALEMNQGWFKQQTVSTHLRLNIETISPSKSHPGADPSIQ